MKKGNTYKKQKLYNNLTKENISEKQSPGKDFYKRKCHELIF